jgi:hypothetical protein
VKFHGLLVVKSVLINKLAVIPKQTLFQSLDSFHIEPVLDIHRNNLHQDAGVVNGLHTSRIHYILDKALLRH